MSTNTPPNGFQQPQGNGFQQPQQSGVPQYQAGPYQAGPFNAPAPAAQKQKKDRLTYLLMCGVPLVIAFIGLFLPYFTISSSGYSESISWAQGDSGGPFIIALIFILVAIIPLAMLFFPKVNPKQLVSSSSLVTVAGVVVIGNVIYNWNPSDVDAEDLSYYGIEVSRSIGFWILLVAGVALVATGILFTMWTNKQAKLAAQPTPNQPYGGPAYPGPQASVPQAPAGQPFGGPAPQQQAPAGQQFGGQAPQQPFASPQSPQTPPPAAPPAPEATDEGSANPSEGSAN